METHLDHHARRRAWFAVFFSEGGERWRVGGRTSSGVVTGRRVRVGGGGSVNVWSHLLRPGEYIIECGGWRGSILGGEVVVMGFWFWQ